MAQTNFCPTCGTSAVADFSFCGACGPSLLKQAVQQEPPAANEDVPAAPAPPRGTNARSGPQSTALASAAKSPHRIRRLVRIWVSGLSLGAVVIGLLMGGWTNLIQVGNGSTKPMSTAAVLIIGGAVILFGYWFCALIDWPIRAIFQQVNVATQPIPSPSQIAVQLEQEWGRAPTIVEVSAVHQMLSARRNEAAVTAGVGLGALYLLDRHG